MHTFAEQEKQPIIPSKVPIFEWKPGTEISYDFDEIDTEDTEIEDAIEQNDIVDLIQDHLAVIS